MRKKNVAIITALAGIAIAVIATVMLITAKNNEKRKAQEERKLITIGFSQVGAESDWRTANSISIKNTFTLEKRV